MPLSLSVAAAAIEATQVPWPFGSTVGSLPNADQPGTSSPARSALEPSTPVSSTAIVDEPAGATVPCTLSHPTCGSAHWSTYDGSEAAPEMCRGWSTSADATEGSDWYCFSIALARPAGTSTTCACTPRTSRSREPPPRATTLCCVVRLSPGFVCTISRTEP